MGLLGKPTILGNPHIWILRDHRSQRLKQQLWLASQPALSPFGIGITVTCGVHAHSEGR